jgi:hypothetical protein
MSAIETLDAQWRDERYKDGIYQGASEAFASMVVYGECTILGRDVCVSFDWPDDAFAADVRTIALKVLERAHAEGRQVEPPDGNGVH